VVSTKEGVVSWLFATVTGFIVGWIVVVIAQRFFHLDPPALL